ncbi:DMT family transporter [Amphritea sp. 1_MG-2023]|uniref:DMT family transporter n=1 Tax=Amphritea sp. 1_MG-2023 TaxID=3062670 RepID=UPI0026E36AEF|nr:DMT family transporter [Amphritea sp. 1_MG-2023]MDO6562549.1 DMT family transporter [Amphritea sp. 1_MG-2023]
MKSNQLLLGAALILLSEMFLVLSGMVIKQLSDELPTEMIVFFRNLLGLALFMPWLMRKGLAVLQTQTLRFHFMRAAVGVTAMTCLFYSWGHLPLAQAALLKQTAPFFMPLIAFWWLGERITQRVKLAILMGFVGVALILNPQQGALNIGILIALLGACLGALAKVTVRRLRVSESPQLIVFYFAFFSALLSAIPAWLTGAGPTGLQFSWLIVLAATSTVAQLLLSKAYGLASAGQLAPFTYGSVVMAVLLGWLIWNEVLGLHTLLGIFCVSVAGIVAMLAKHEPVKRVIDPL